MVMEHMLRGIAQGATRIANGYKSRKNPQRRVPTQNSPRRVPVPTQNPVRMNNKALEQYYLNQLIEKGVLDAFYRNKIRNGAKLNSIMRNKMMEWKQKLGISNNKTLQNKYGNLSSMNTLKKIRNAATKAQGSQNANRRKQNVTAYLKSLNEASLNAFLNQAGVKRGPKGPNGTKGSNGKLISLLDQRTGMIISKLDEVLELARQLKKV
jgi:hypothetical protein